MSKHKILFLHGWLFDRRIWFGLDRIISGGNQSVLVDLPGYGKNKENNSTLVSYCREIFSSQLSPTVIIGWSFGGTLALLGLSRYCPNIEKIVITAVIKNGERARLALLNIIIAILQNIAALNAAISPK